MQKPAGIWVVSILFWLGGVMGILGGLMVMKGGSFLMMPGIGPRGGAFGATLGFLGFVVLIFAILELLVGYGIYALQSWARIVGIILSILGLLSFPIGTLISLVILYFLIVDKTTVNAFQT